MSDLIKKLPQVFQTTPQKKFFDATFDQAFSKKDSEYIAGYLGRRPSGGHDPINDYYKPEPTKNRTWWQLEPTVVSRDRDLNRTNIFFYEDLLNKIDFYGGNTLNQDRLFSDQYYSWAPPIDFDMFINYQSYYWLDQPLPTISVTGTLISQVEGQSQRVIMGDDNSTGQTFLVSTGMVLEFVDDPLSQGPLTVDLVNGRIQLTAVSSASASSGTFHYLPWDGSITMGDGTSVNNQLWDTKTWEIEPHPAACDYTVIQRGDANLWSVNNRWVHVDVINQVTALTGNQFPSGASRALRPIIQFDRGLILYRSGSRFKSLVSLGFGSRVGSPVRLAQVNYRPRIEINQTYGVDIKDGDTVVFLEDNTVTSSGHLVNQVVYQVSRGINDTVFFQPTHQDVVETGDVIRFTDTVSVGGVSRDQSWYWTDGVWSRAYNDKEYLNQPPRFTLFDHEGVPLDDTAKYPGSTFSGSPIFSYHLDTQPGARVDPVLGQPIVYTSLGQSSDIVFANNLVTDRYQYGGSLTSIDGYYYYQNVNQPAAQNGWHLYRPGPGAVGGNQSHQRVIDRGVVGYGLDRQLMLSVTPIDYPGFGGTVVTVGGVELKPHTLAPNGYHWTEINGRIYVDLTDWVDNVGVATGTVVEAQTITSGQLDPELPGYFEIPLNLQSNPNQAEVSLVNGSDLTTHFSSIVSSQVGFSGLAVGGSNNYRDLAKNPSLGGVIVQSVSPAIKAGLVSSDETLDLISAIRFSQTEYTSFKNRFLSTARRLIDTAFDPQDLHNNSVKLNYWVDEILKTVNVSREYSGAFSLSYMIPCGEPLATETFLLDVRTNIILDTYVDLTDFRNSILVYDVTGGDERLLLADVDYTIVSVNNIIEIEPRPHLLCQRVSVVVYQNPAPSYIPSTPTRLGLYGASIPRISLDTTYATPTQVIIGHDGSRTVAFGDFRDQLLLELERRIYNQLQPKFRGSYQVPVEWASVFPGHFRTTDYSRAEMLAIVESHLNRWSARNRANYRINEFHQVSDSVPVSELWKLYNYRTALTTGGSALNMPGHWRGIYTHLYDTVRPAQCPWEMLGFTTKPNWWEEEYGSGVVNSQGVVVWTSLSAGMWADLEAGIIRRGPRAVYDPQTLTPLANSKWARPGLRTMIPVDAVGQMVPVPALLGLATSGDPYEPFDGFDNDWEIGDLAPVEYAWRSTSEWAYTVCEILYLTRPSEFSEAGWDTLGVDYSPGLYTPLGHDEPVRLDGYTQRVQTDIYHTPGLFDWFRPRNENQWVHGETRDGVTQLRFGYQTWISDRIMFSGSDLTGSFGLKIRNAGVVLANRMAGFTNRDTVNAYIESVSLNSNTTTLAIPSSDFSVHLHRSPPVLRLAYSGVIVRALAGGEFSVHGYDLLNSEFMTLERDRRSGNEVSVGGTPAGFRIFTPGDTYDPGEIVKYNGVYYASRGTQSSMTFDPISWTRLRSLPVEGGLTVTHYPGTTGVVKSVPYGTVFRDLQSVFDFFIGYGDYLASVGWIFDSVDEASGEVSDWLRSARQFLFWVNSNWAPDQSIQLSPLAAVASVRVSRGYPDNVETMRNGVYSILDQWGVAIPAGSTATDRSGDLITVTPVDRTTGGIYFLQVTSSETEHAILFENITSFGDVVYSPLLSARQARIRFNGFRTNGWTGKAEAPGSFIIGDQLVPNFNTIVENSRFYYDPNVRLDDPNMEDLGRRLIGYESRGYMDDLMMSPDVGYLFYRGMIRKKGTAGVIDRLFRSSAIQSNDGVAVSESWALKTGSFGGVTNQVSTEIVLKPESHWGNSVIARLNFQPSGVYVVTGVEIINAETQYTTRPQVLFEAPPPGINIDDVGVFAPGYLYQAGDLAKWVKPTGVMTVFSSRRGGANNEFDPAEWQEVTLNRTARGYVELGSDRRIQRIVVSDSGSGYTSRPGVIIVDDVGVEDSRDRAYAVIRGVSQRDVSLDNIVDIDIDDTELWKIRPENPRVSLNPPKTTQLDFELPNAGYVNFTDVDWYSFDVASTVLNWGQGGFQPEIGDSVWVAKTFNQDWNVYKLVEFVGGWKIVESDLGILTLLTENGVILGTQGSQRFNHTDFGNLITISSEPNTDGFRAINLTVGFQLIDSNYIDPDTGDMVVAYQLENLDGVALTSNEIVGFDLATRLSLFKTLRWATRPAEGSMPTYIGIDDRIWVDDLGQWTVLNWTVSPGEWDVYRWDVRLGQTWGVSSSGDSSPYNYGWDAHGPMVYSVHRQYEPMIDTSLYENAAVFNGQWGDQLATLPVYDPFKGSIPGEAKRNLTYITPSDPARYTLSSGEITMAAGQRQMGEANVGELWWDTSTVRYVYYEQPLARDGSETAESSLGYRRDLWGATFPGSSVDVYEWVSSPTPPLDYQGTGVVKSTTDYVAKSVTDPISGISTVRYYFWVLGRTTRPNKQNRTMAARDVSQLIADPRGQGYGFFSPIGYSNDTVSYGFFNVTSLLNVRGDNVRITYRRGSGVERHSQWTTFQPGRVGSVPPTQHWDSMVRSLAGYSAGTPGRSSVEFQLDGVTARIQPVPDRALSDRESLGVSARPAQSMFSNRREALRVFQMVANQALSGIRISDYGVNWADLLPTLGGPLDLWRWATWYQSPEYQGVKATRTVSDLPLALAQSQPGDLVRVINGTRGSVIYLVSGTAGSLTMNPVVVENGTIELTDSVWSGVGRWSHNRDITEILGALTQVILTSEAKNQVFAGMLNYVVSEQPQTNWVFKTSEVMIRETTQTLDRVSLFRPDQTASVLSYIRDVKPYHVQITGYSSGYSVTSVASGGVGEVTLSQKSSLKFQPGFSILSQPGWDEFHWDAQNWAGPAAELNHADVQVNGNTWSPDSGVFGVNPLLGCENSLDQFVGREDVYMVNRLVYDPTLNDNSGRFPYLIDFGVININSPQKNPAPGETVAILHNGQFLYNGVDFTVEYLGGDRYVARLVANPCSATLDAFIWFEGGGFDLDTSRATATLEGNTQYSGSGVYGMNPLLVCTGVDQFISQENTYQLTGLSVDLSYRGYSQTYPVVIDFSRINLMGPQNQVIPSSVVGLEVSGEILYYGYDYTVEHISGERYVARLFNDPGQSTITALIWFNGGDLSRVYQPSYRNELALTSGYDHVVVNVDTRMPIPVVNGTPTLPGGWGWFWDGIDPSSILAQEISQSGGSLEVGWDNNSVVDYEVELRDHWVSYRQSVSDSGSRDFVRNSANRTATLINTVESPRADSAWLDMIRVAMDPLVPDSLADILPTPDLAPGVIWINGERLEYRAKTQVDSHTWDLSLVARGTRETTPAAHAPGSWVHIEAFNVLPAGAQGQAWNSGDEFTSPDPATQSESVGKYTSISSPSPLGVWYGGTQSARFLRDQPGKSIQ